jgi:hypothetical protein
MKPLLRGATVGPVEVEFSLSTFLDIRTVYVQQLLMKESTVQFDYQKFRRAGKTDQDRFEKKLNKDHRELNRLTEPTNPKAKKARVLFARTISRRVKRSELCTEPELAPIWNRATGLVVLSKQEVIN